MMPTVLSPILPLAGLLNLNYLCVVYGHRGIRICSEVPKGLETRDYSQATVRIWGRGVKIGLN